MKIGNRPSSQSTATLIRCRIEQHGERLWRLADFPGLPFTATAQTLSRLAREGTIQRLSKGIYYRPRQTALGPSRPNPAAIQKLALKDRKAIPSGIAAAGLLGFTTQSPARAEIATTATSLPRKLLGPDTIIHTRRPQAWARLSTLDAALLEFLRSGGRTSELSADDTIARTLRILRESGRYARLLSVAGTEPPRVRALLGALGEQMGRDNAEELRGILNPLSRFDFGIFSAMPNAKAWYGKTRR